MTKMLSCELLIFWYSSSKHTVGEKRCGYSVWLSVAQSVKHFPQKTALWQMVWGGLLSVSHGAKWREAFRLRPKKVVERKEECGGWCIGKKRKDDMIKGGMISSPTWNYSLMMLLWCNCLHFPFAWTLFGSLYLGLKYHSSGFVCFS